MAVHLSQKAPPRTVANLVDHGDLSEPPSYERIYKAKEILANKCVGSFFIVESNSSSKCIYNKIEGDGYLGNGIDVQFANNTDVEKIITEGRERFKVPVLSEPHIKRKSEAVNLICQMALANEDQKVKIKEELRKAKAGINTFKINDTIFIVKRRMENNQKSIEINKLIEINRGLTGIVYNVFNVNAQICGKIVKLAHQDELSKKCMGNEIEMLKSFGGSKGIQETIDEIIEFMDEIGYMTVKYLVDGIDEFPENADWAQLIEGLKGLHENDIVHGDIKPENIYYKEPNTLALADFGGARKMEYVKEKFINGILQNEKMNQVLSDLFGMTSKRQVSHKIFLEVTHKVIEFARNRQGIDEKVISEFFENNIRAELFKLDEFALGISLYYMSIRELPPFKSFTCEDKERFSGQDEAKEDINAAIERMGCNLWRKHEKLETSVMNMIRKGI